VTLPAPDDAVILVVDDDLDMRAMLRDVLARAGFRVEEAATSDELFALVPRVAPAAIILDHEMPGDWGLEVLAALRSAHPEVPVIFVTAFGSAGMRDAATRDGAAAYLAKPFHLDDLIATLHRLVAPSRLAS
jgi:two-component system nitrogen regulation response regulator GlnG